MGVVKTASESILEEAVVPSEEANYSVQGHAGKLIFIFRTVRLYRWRAGTIHCGIDEARALRRNGE